MAREKLIKVKDFNHMQFVFGKNKKAILAFFKD